MFDFPLTLLLSSAAPTPQPQLLTGLPRNAACIDVGGSTQGVTHWLLSHQLYKVTRGQERGGASVSARGDSGEGHEPQPSLWAPVAGLGFLWIL